MSEKRNITLTIDPVAMASTIITAMEQGIGYWAHSPSHKDKVPAAADRLGKEHDLPAYAFAPLTPTGFLAIDEVDNESLEAHESEDGYVVVETHQLSLAAIERGLNLMAAKEGLARFIGDVLTGAADANAADAFVQLCVLGEVRYG